MLNVVSAIFIFTLGLVVTSCSEKEIAPLRTEAFALSPDHFHLKIQNYCLPISEERVHFMALNLNIRYLADQRKLDTDADGVLDQDENRMANELLLSTTEPDTNNDGYEDLAIFRTGLNRDEQLKLTPCESSLDSDMDGISDCAETIIGTDPKLIDSDNDLLPDGIELIYGLSPKLNDAPMDSDSDGVSNLEEITRGTDHLHTDIIPEEVIKSIDPDSDEIARIPHEVIYEQTRMPSPADTVCFDYTVKNLSFDETQKTNRLRLIFIERKQEKLVIRSFHQDVRVPSSLSGNLTSTFNYVDERKKSEGASP